jgi:hypothetical protein
MSAAAGWANLFLLLFGGASFAAFLYGGLRAFWAIH